ncbi:MAG: xanthine dehydrogenase family protein molybdopterin-binding subunit [Daejeonella sp.]|uniref:xanthine dehydrogenase family protein molybdopterin-binding subunit n=1 Tax=Daejeonella sp. TaxID=2805397 RepID=UPI003C776E11
MSIEKKYFGQALNRIDGHAKVRGEAKYAAEFNITDLLYGYIINSTITKGKIKSINTEKASAITGVIKVFTHENRESTAWLNLKYTDMDAPPGVPFRPLHDRKINYNGQPVALVVAETFELARYAATLVDIQYESDPHQTDLRSNLSEARKPKKGLASIYKPGPPKAKGNAELAFNNAPIKASGTFVHGMETHNPLEMFASTVIYEQDGKLTIYDKTQGALNSQIYVANVFGKSFKNVRVLSPYVGGAFGSGLRPQYQLFLAVMASLDLRRSVRVSMNRHQMFTFGHRPATVQNTRFSAIHTGKIQSLYHDATAETSRFEDYSEVVVNWSNELYPSNNVKLGYKLVPLDLASPLDMRAPGGATGLHAIECTIDALAYKCNIDPIEFRLHNYAYHDDSSGKPFSSKELKECFHQGAKRFGWENRSPQPRSMKRDGKLLGWGMASGIWEASQLPARAEALLTTDGKLIVSSATADIGTGTYTIMAQIAADCMGMDISNVESRLGDSNMPIAPIQGGSFTSATIGMAVHTACQGLKKSILKQAKKMNPGVFHKMNLEEVEFTGDTLRIKDTTNSALLLTDIVASTGKMEIKSRNTGLPNTLKQRKYNRSAHSAVFVEVEVDEELGSVKVCRVVTAIAAGKIINPKTARSQILGGMVWGISKTLHEESIIDHRFGRIMNSNLGEYHIAVNADINDLDVIFVDEEDTIVNDLQIKGIGEIGIVGVPPAIANAIFHATGKRIYDLPIKLDMVMA